MRIVLDSKFVFLHFVGVGCALYKDLSMVIIVNSEAPRVCLDELLPRNRNFLIQPVSPHIKFPGGIDNRVFLNTKSVSDQAPSEICAVSICVGDH